MRYRIKKNGLQLVLNELQTIILIVELLLLTPVFYIADVAATSHP